MRITTSALVKICLLLSFAFQAACHRIAVEVKPAPGAKHYAPTDMSNVDLLRTPPQSKYVSLGEIVVRPGERLTDLQLDRKLREEAAQLGANAALIISDRSYAVAGAPRGGFANTYQSLSTNVRVVTAQAIRYTR